MAGEIVRALRVVEYIGNREFLDRHMQGSAWSERPMPDGIIKAAWIGITPGPLSPEAQAQENHRQAVERRRDAAIAFVNAIADSDPNDLPMDLISSKAKEIQRS